jgi:hypothetical protein
LSKPDRGFILIQNPSRLQMGVESAKADLQRECRDPYDTLFFGVRRLVGALDLAA